LTRAAYCLLSLVPLSMAKIDISPLEFLVLPNEECERKMFRRSNCHGLTYAITRYFQPKRQCNVVEGKSRDVNLLAEKFRLNFMNGLLKVIK
jgi:hypothetical protein